ncbi:MBL fold metallo-hydrolase [Leptolyngbya boryana CZ1]|uniref:MBL fold metallo-hydrolase n=1 Tax=Leptolyngbya boryana CZ1 TaxID=3060204 RepID=A0AA96WWH1_LEPBY|nr:MULTISPECIES: MBL fold metallo-hydrolase [Leptolyngbya]MBD1857383.1 MBL fold metallo-hydrolase [Leptolyngbya sp. FACHB-1624]MBN8562016.1 MBL fold metallo-hydrolase [Leptolyngbya sp. UWPOB_LEPTO1]WNZ46697.1 MBL fold metallo-hydrolase [Leptolyngbya boryana CZ1]
MKRRQFIQYAGAGLVAGAVPIAAQAQSGGLTVQYLGHMCFLFTGGGRRILVNPFRSAGCTAGYRAPKVAADLVMISSQILDEGAIDVVPGNPKLLVESGAYDINGFKAQGIAMDHDRVGGKRFGRNIAWRWSQGGLNVVHLGGAAAPITLEQKILIGSPDVVFLPVGGGAKAYDPQEAKQALQVLNAKIIVPMYYRTAAAKEQCDIGGLDAFLSVMSGTPVRKGGSSISLTKANLPKEGSVIQVMTYA